MGMIVTREALARMFPRALPEWLDALERLAPQLMEHYGFNRLDWCGIVGQIDAETDGLALKSMAEDMRFSAERMLEVYSKRLRDCVGVPVPPLGGRVFASKAALARALAHNGPATADVVYGGPHGREGTPPWRGSLYIGRGPLQETHLNNYRAARDEICRQPGGPGCPDLVSHPECLADDPELGVRDVFAQWKLKGLSRYAQRQEWETLSDVLNTGNANDSVKPFGLPRRLRATARALAIWPDEAGDISPAKSDAPAVMRQGDRNGEVKRLQERLIELGYGPGPADGTFGVLTTRAVVAFQAEHDLKPDGIAGPRTLEVMAATAKAPGEHNDIVAADLPKSSTVAAARWIKRTVAGVFGFNVVSETADQAGLGFVDMGLGQAEKVKSLAERVQALGIPIPTGRLVLAALIALACAALWHWAGKIEIGRALAARRGG